jgi:adenylate cyclase
MIEIERKFLVLSNDFINEAFSQKRIVQAYLSSNPDRTVRIRIKGDKGFITIKGKSNANGTTRLVMAEIELESEEETFEKPNWLGEEVTNDERYYNAYLSKKPFTTW